MRKPILNAAGLSLLLLVAGCSAASNGFGEAVSESADTTGTANGTAGAQLNDLSVLYPLATSSAQMDAYLKATSATAGGPLLPLALFNTVTGASTKTTGATEGLTDSAGINAGVDGGDASTEDAGADGGVANIDAGSDTVSDPGSMNVGLVPGASPQLVYSDLRAVAFRLDPCFANIGPVTDPSSCQNQIRVIFQSLTFSDGSATAVDGAVHVFFSLTRAEFVAAVNEVIAARQASDPSGADLGPLAVHPLLARQGLGGKMTKALNKIVLKYASSANILRLTQFLAGNLDTDWSFSGINVAKGKATPMDIASLASGTTSETFALGFGAFLSEGEYLPGTKSSDNMQILANSMLASAATPAVQRAAFDSALRVQSPDFDSPNTIDCASCHTAQFAQVVVGQNMLGLSASGPYSFVPNPSYVPAGDTLATTPVTATTAFNLHAFSYSGSNPMINQRVMNETEALVAYVNGEVLQAQ